MKLETIKQRIENAEQKIQKKQNTITKKLGWIEKKQSKLSSLQGTERQWAEWDIKNYQDDIKRLEGEIKEIESSLENYKKQLSGELAKEEILLKEIPESMKRMQQELVARWDAYDKERRERIKEDYINLEYRDFLKRYNYSERMFRYKTDEQIHNDNVQDAKCLILDLYYRVRHITGEIVDWSNVHATCGAQGMTVLNGFVRGKEGRCEIESILAGGYNIQRLHVRVLVREI